MHELKERIIAEGIVREGNVLKVDSFLNHFFQWLVMDLGLFIKKTENTPT